MIEVLISTSKSWNSVLNYCNFMLTDFTVSLDRKAVFKIKTLIGYLPLHLSLLVQKVRVKMLFQRCFFKLWKTDKGLESIRDVKPYLFKYTSPSAQRVGK